MEITEATETPEEIKNYPAYSKFGYGSTFGDYSTFGDGCVIEGIAMRKIITLANVDGSGREILIVFGEDKTLIRAGCFLGSVEEFAAKATKEGKLIYAEVIPAVVKITESQLNLKR